jgi:aminoglycoside 3-N-acetyltransferase
MPDGTDLAVAELTRELRQLPLEPGRDLLVHASLRRLGTPPDAASTVAAALRQVIGIDATLVVPTHTANNSLSSPAFLRAIDGMDEPQRHAYVERMPGFDRRTTPSFQMGALAEHVRQHSRAVRSSHPQTSFAALGPAAAALTAIHDVECQLGDRSPLGTLYERDAQVLLLGVGFDACTAFHLAEYHLPDPPYRLHQCFVDDGGVRKMVEFLGVDLRDHDFVELGQALVEQGHDVRGSVRAALCHSFPLRAAVDFAIHWLSTHR